MKPTKSETTEYTTVPILANLTPVYETYTHLSASITALNSQIATMAVAEVVTLVNLNTTFAGNRSLIQDDGLHPTASGAALIATAFSSYVD